MSGMRICLVTPAQLSRNPRLVKEADALWERGYDVRVVACHWMDWAMSEEGQALAPRGWHCQLVDWSRKHSPNRFWYTRLRQHFVRRVFARFTFSLGVAERAMERAVPELTSAAASEPADLFIAHNLAALPAAARAARQHGARLGFDAEDFHSGMRHAEAPKTKLDDITEYIERRYLSQCDYITAGSPLIAEAYASQYQSIPRPIPILNAFPLSHRPVKRPCSPDSGALRLYWFSQTIGADRGLEDIVRAMGHLSDCEIELHLRGDCQPGYKQRLLDLASSLAVRPEKVVFHLPAPSEEMVRLASQYDVGLALEQPVSENREICLTNKLFVYLLAGNAIVATATRGQHPVIQEIGEAGLCYSPSRLDLLVVRLRRWYEDRESLRCARRLSWSWGTQKYNWDQEKLRFLGVVKNVLRGSEGRLQRLAPPSPRTGMSMSP